MTVVIEDLNKPKDCWECLDKFCIWDEEHGKYYCAVNGDWINFEDGSVNLDCPLEDYKGTERDTKRKTGIWMGSVCSECGNSTSFYYDCDFCPHCGADMRGEI